MNILELLKKSISDPQALLMALRLVADLSDGNTRLSAETRGEIQAKILELEAGVK
ncbi:hypothetical protein MF271_22700 (plasmid) [Deinococcus sp. KNUC1210]|uniref:hypothetical protein n=1 Tax=Deinococcus sp. KNUC1210 TaxID=2917691 RepID=UPI001EF01EC0|nr:hypothetical protein [Deinococcus sp. KNUC1210]ULH18276.1 hypothetical protein MF271_22700 [Deinococcus sp. KNUC1210]